MTNNKKEPAQQDELPDYDFSDHEEMIEASIDLWSHDEEPSREQQKHLQEAINDFLRTRTNSELMDMADMDPSFWDWNHISDAWHAECDTRFWPMDAEARRALKSLSFYYSSKDSVEYQVKELIKQVNGIQRKVDAIHKVLTNVNISMSASDAVDLAR